MFGSTHAFDQGVAGENAVRSLVRDILALESSGPRGRDGSVVWWGSEHGSSRRICSPADARIRAVVDEIGRAGLTVADVNAARGGMADIPEEVRVIWLWQPTEGFTPLEVASLGEFTAAGGLIVFVGGERSDAVRDGLLAGVDARAVNPLPNH